MTDRYVEVKIDLGERIATVTRNCTEKYARKRLQDLLKETTPFKGGWSCSLLNPDWNSGEDYPNTKLYSVKSEKTGLRTYSGNGVKDADNYIFELNNPFATLAGYL